MPQTVEETSQAEATQLGVETGEKNDGSQQQEVDQQQAMDLARPMSPRDIMMQRINAARSEEIAAGYEDGSLVPVDDDLLEQEPDLIPTKVKTSRADNPDDEVELLRVDGKDVWVKKAQIFDTGKRSLQKEIAADKRLEEVAGREANVRAKETELARMEAELPG